jgi:hypothetical protein
MIEYLPRLKVGNPAELLEPDEVPTDLANALETNEVGIASSDAWMTFHEREPRGAIRLTVEEIGLRYPFDDEDEEFAEENVSVPVDFWIPRSPEECDRVLSDLKAVDPNIYSLEWIEGCMKDNLGKPFHTIVAVRDARSGKNEGVFVYNRYLTLEQDKSVTASLNYHIKVFHAEGSPAVRQALLMTLHDQTIADLECGINSLHKAGIVADVVPGLDVEDDDDGMYASYVEAVDVAAEWAFMGAILGEDVDLHRYGEWISGIPHVPSSAAVTL